MSRTSRAGAALFVVAGFLLVGSGTPDAALAGALLVAGGAYALILPQFIEPKEPATR